MNKFIKALNEKKLIIGDGAMGTALQEMGLDSGESPEKWNLYSPDKIKKVHQKYLEAGAELIETNTFGGNYIRLKDSGLEDKIEEINKRAVEIARKVAKPETIVAGSVGPTGKMIKPLGIIEEKEAIESYYKQILILVDQGIDVLIIETMVDLNEIKTALKAASNFEIPVIAQMNFDESGNTVMGHTLEDLVSLKDEFKNIEIIGINCTPGVEISLSLIKKLKDKTDSNLSVFPNAGEPELKQGKVYYPEGPEDFTSIFEKFIENQVKIIGGCCGTTPKIIAAIRNKVRKLI